MADDPSISLVNLGDITKPADTLIKKVSKAVGGIFAPYQIKRIAKAEAARLLSKRRAKSWSLIFIDVPCIVLLRRRPAIRRTLKILR